MFMIVNVFNRKYECIFTAYGRQYYQNSTTTINRTGTYTETLRSDYQCIDIPRNISSILSDLIQLNGITLSNISGQFPNVYPDKSLCESATGQTCKQISPAYVEFKGVFAGYYLTNGNEYMQDELFTWIYTTEQQPEDSNDDDDDIDPDKTYDCTFTASGRASGRTGTYEETLRTNYQCITIPSNISDLLATYLVVNGVQLSNIKGKFPNVYPYLQLCEAATGQECKQIQPAYVLYKASFDGQELTNGLFLQDELFTWSYTTVQPLQSNNFYENFTDTEKILFIVVIVVGVIAIVLLIALIAVAIKLQKAKSQVGTSQRDNVMYGQNYYQQQNPNQQQMYNNGPQRRDEQILPVYQQQQQPYNYAQKQQNE